jgi:hypothetical protein
MNNDIVDVHGTGLGVAYAVVFNAIPGGFAVNNLISSSDNRLSSIRSRASIATT